MIVLQHMLRESKDDFCSLADQSLNHLPNGILSDLPVRLALEEELFDHQSIQLGHIGFVRVAGQDHHVGDLADLQTASLLLVEGHPAGVVGTHFQCLLNGHGLGTVVAGFVNPHDGVGIGAGTVGTEGLDDAVIGIGLEGVQLCGTIAQNGLQIFVRLVGPVDEGTLDCQGDAVFGTDADTLLGGQTGVDDGVPVVGTGMIVQSGLQCPCGLLEGGIAYGMDLNLHTLPVGLFTEFGHLLVGVIQDAGVVGAHIGLKHCGIRRAKAPVQSGIKASADSGELASLGLLHIHRLEVHTHLQTIAQTLGEPVFHIYIQIHCIAYATDGMDHTDALRGQMVGGGLHIADQLHRGNGTADIVGKGKKRLLIHFTGGLVIAPEIFCFLLQNVQELRVHHTGVAVVLDHEQGLVRTDLVQLLPSDELLLRNRVGRCAEGNDQLVRAGRDKGADHVQDLCIAFGIGHIQPGMEGGEAGKMDVTVPKGRDQRTTAQLHPGTAGEFRRQFIAHIDDPTAVLDQIPANTILRIAGQNGAFVDFHGGTSVNVWGHYSMNAGNRQWKRGFVALRGILRYNEFRLVVEYMIKKYNKLVRDRIPEIIESSGNTCVTEILSDEDYLRMLDAKLDEELAEYHKDQNIEELADLMEVIYAAAMAQGYTPEQLEQVRREKAEKRGGFERKILLKEVIEQ